MKALLTALFTLVSCAPITLASEGVERCVTRCGLAAEGNCAALGAIEARATEAFGNLYGGGEKAVCASLRGWKIRTHVRRASDSACEVAKSWVLSAGKCILGYTHEGAKIIELPDTDWGSGAFAHELVHVLDIEFYSKAGHCAWKERGIKKVLLAIQGREDETPPDAFCPSL